MVALRKGEYEKAAELWRKAQRLNPNLPGVYGRYALALLEMGKLEEAVAALEKEIKISPRNSENYFLLGQAYLQQKEHKKAAEGYKRALEIRPDSSKACYGLAVAYARLGQGDKAREYREKFTKLQSEEGEAVGALRRRPDDRAWTARVLARIRTEAGRLYYRHGNFLEAEEHWQRAAALDPKNEVCRQQLVDLLIRRRRQREAVEICEQLRETDPKNATYHLNTGVLLARLQRFDAAEQALRKAIELAPKRTTGYFSLVRVLMLRKGKLSEAKTLAQKLVEMEATAQNYAVLGEACYRSADLAGAHAALEQASKLNPADREYRRVRRLVEERK